MLISFHLDEFPRVGWLDHKVDLFSDFLKIPSLSSTMTLFMYIPTKSALGQLFLHILTSHFYFLIFEY